MTEKLRGVKSYCNGPAKNAVGRKYRAVQCAESCLLSKGGRGFFNLK